MITLMLKKRYTAAQFGLSLCLIIVALPAYSAGPYRLELHGGFSRTDTSSNSSSEFSVPTPQSYQSTDNYSTDSLDFSGDYYFRSIETNNGPLQEAAFLAKASTLTFSVSKSRLYNKGQSYTYRSNNYDLGYQFVAPERPWIGVVSYGGNNQSLRQTNYSLGMGRYIGRRSSVVAEYGSSHYRGTSLRFETLTIRARSLLRIGAQHYLAVSAALHRSSETSPTHGEPYRTYEFGVTYYPRDDISIALSTNGNYHLNIPYVSDDTRGYLLEANWFLNESITLGAGYETSRERANSAYPGLGYFTVIHSNADGFRLSFSWRH